MLTKTTNSLPHKAFIALCLMLCSIVSCNEDDPQPEELILGMWTVESSRIDIFFDGQSLVKYFMDVYQISMIEAELLEHNLLKDYLDDFQGSITLNADNTYTMAFGGDSSSGNWKLSEDGKILTFDEGTEDETEATIIKLSPNTMVVEMEDSSNGDIDGDGDDDEIILQVTLTLKK